MKTKRVVAMFDVVMEEEGNWDKTDIAMHLELCTRSRTWHNATVWDSLDDFLVDLHSGYVELEQRS